MVGTQEIIALMIVMLVIAFALYRRARKNKNSAKAGCADCDKPADNTAEKTVHFFRKQD